MVTRIFSLNDGSMTTHSAPTPSMVQLAGISKDTGISTILPRSLMVAFSKEKTVGYQENLFLQFTCTLLPEDFSLLFSNNATHSMPSLNGYKL
jgi:hypothetical protein